MASGKLKGFGSTLVSLAGDAGPLLKAMLAISAVVIGFIAASVQMAAQYDQSMRMVQALTGSSTQQMAYYDAGVKQLAMDAGVAPKALADGLYNVLSASYSGADAMKVLTLATQDAKIGMTDAKVTTDALTNILRSFGTKSQDITRVNGEMLQTVTLGKATFEQYAQSIVKSASSANQFHVSMETMNAAWATMTSSGIRAAQASTDFQQSLKVMYGNVNTVAASLHKNGIAFDVAKFNAMSYGDKVVYLNQALDQANNKHVKITGVTIQAAQAVQTIAKHIGDYKNNLATLSDKQAMAQKTQEAWDITQKGFNQSLARAQAAVQVLMIDIGQQLLPVLTRIVDAVAPAVTWFLNFASAVSKNEVAMAFIKGAIAGFVVVLLAVLIPALWAWATAAGAAALMTLAATWPILLVGAIVAAVVAGIILAVQHWGAIVAWLKGVWGNIVSWFHGLWNGIVNVAKAGVMFLLGVIFGPILAIGALFVWLYQHNTYFKMLIDAIVHFVQSGIDWLRAVWTVAVSWLAGKWNELVNYAKAVWAAVSLVFSSIWNTYIARPLASLWASIQKWFSDLGKGAADSGKNFISMLVQGITSGAGAIWNAVTGIANQIWKALGFHSPTEAGPGRDADRWMPNLVSMLSRDLVAGVPRMQQAVHQVAAPLQGLNPASGSGYGTPYGRPPTSSNSTSYSSAQGGNTYITLGPINGGNANAKEIADQVIARLSRAYRRSGDVVVLTSGGKAS